jgi:hypothetical protein
MAKYTTAIVVPVARDTHAEIRRLAEQDGRTIAGLMRRLIDRTLAEGRQPQEQSADGRDHA